MTNIEVMVKHEKDLYEKYDNSISKELLEYIINKAWNKTDDINIIIRTNLKLNNIEELLFSSFDNYYNELLETDKRHDGKQILFFILGILFFIFSTLVHFELTKEIIIIAAWVTIWEVLDIS